MKLQNFTPFPALQFDSRDEKQNDFGVVVLRGTFEIQNGKRLRLAQDQVPLDFKDNYFGDPQQTSIRMESCLAPFKPKTDVLVTCLAHSPTRQPQKQWDVEFRFGSISKKLTVTGKRKWTRTRQGFELSEITPATQVPVVYELAYGGSYIGQDDKLQSWPHNPVGLGFVDPQNVGDEIDAPQILPHGTTELQWGQEVETVGLGPIAPSWKPRCDQAGTYNVIWEKTRCPDLPEDFSYEFYNSASTGLTLPGYADGAEKVGLLNLSRERQLVFGLPGFDLATLFRFESGNLVPGPVVLDTVHIDVPRNLVFLTWRGVIPLNVPMRALEVRVKSRFEQPVQSQPVAAEV